jgi:pilus assembly protein Flp/PilA
MNRLASFAVRSYGRVSARFADEDGQGLVEYAFILVMIALVVILTLIILGNQTKNLYQNISQGLVH